MKIFDVKLEGSFGLEHGGAHAALELPVGVVSRLVTTKLGRSSARNFADLKIFKMFY